MNETTDASAIFAPLWKRKWLILAVGVIVAAATFAYYRHQPSLYESATEIYLGGAAEIQSLLANSPGSPVQNERSIDDQTELINSSLIGEAVRRQLVSEHDLAAASGTAQAASAKDTDFITITAQASTGAAAAKLANTYASVYLREQDAAYRKNVELVLANTRQQLQSTQQGAKHAGSQTVQQQALSERVGSLQSELALGDTGDRQVDPALASASPISPKPTRNAIFGFVLGLVLAAIAAYTLSRFDRRLRSLADIEDAFHSQILAALPSTRRPIVHREGELTIADQLREPLRGLHTMLQLRERDRAGDNHRSLPRSIMFISAEAGDGKSVTVAGLALVQREAGARVAVVEADLRRPVQAELFSLSESDGLVEVLAGHVAVNDALHQVNSMPSNGAGESRHSADAVATALGSQHAGSLAVLASGGVVANPPALLAEPTMPRLLRSIADDYDFVLIDAPPPLEVSDVMPLLHMVDALVIVARVGHTRRASAKRLLELLDRGSSAPVVGVVANDVPQTELEGHGLSSGYYDHRPRRRL